MKEGGEGYYREGLYREDVINDLLPEDYLHFSFINLCSVIIA